MHGQQLVATIDSTYVLTRTSTPSSLKPIDIVVLKKLSDVVNVVPVIAKADSLTLEERQAFKERIKEEFAFHNLKMYPYDNDELDDEERAINAQIKVCDCTSLSKAIRL